MRRKREDIVTPIKQILDEKYDLLPIDEKAPHNYPDVIGGILQLELKQEIDALTDMLFYPDTFKEKFKERCTLRETNNEQSNISFHVMPESLSNQMYWEIAQRLFQPQTMNEMLEILLPSITHYLTVDVTYVQPKLPNMPSNKLPLPVKLIAHTDRLVDPVLIENLSHYVLVNDILLDVKEIALFPLTMHVALYSTLNKKYPHVANSLYQHNAQLSELSKDILAFNAKGITPKLAIEQLILGFTLGGQKITGEGYASQSALNAIQRFFDYFNALPKELKTQLRSLEGINYTLGSIIDHQLEKGLCVETTATSLTCILSKNKEQTILTASPVMSEMDLNELKKKYQYKNYNGLDTKKDGYFIPIFPIQLTKTVVKRFTIDTTNKLIDLVINFPTTLYEVLWQNVSFNQPYDYYGKLVKFINDDYFDQEQKQALAKAATSQYSRFKFEKSLLVWASTFNDPLFLQEAIRIYPKPNLLKTITAAGIDNNLPLIFTIVKQPETLKILVDNLLEEEELFKAITVQRDDGNTPLCLVAAKQPDDLKMLLAPLSENDRLKAIMVQNNDGNTPLCFAAALQPKSIKILLDFLPKQNLHLAITVPNKNGITPLRFAATKQPEAFKMLMTSFAEQDRMNPVIAPYRNGTTLLGLIVRDFPESLQVLENLLPKNDLIFIKLIKAMNKASVDFIEDQAKANKQASQIEFFYRGHSEKVKKNGAQTFQNDLLKITSTANAIELIDDILHTSTSLFREDSFSSYLLNELNSLNQEKNDPALSPEEHNANLTQNWIEIKKNLEEPLNLYHNPKNNL